MRRVASFVLFVAVASACSARNVDSYFDGPAGASGASAAGSAGSAGRLDVGGSGGAITGGPPNCADANDSLGCCDGDVLYFCHSGVLSSGQNCAPSTCGWNAGNGYYDCGPPPNADPDVGGPPRACRGTSSAGAGGTSAGHGGGGTSAGAGGNAGTGGHAGTGGNAGASGNTGGGTSAGTGGNTSAGATASGGSTSAGMTASGGSGGSEVGGGAGGPPACAPAIGDAPCIACAKENCCSPFVACAADGDCSTCVDGGSTCPDNTPFAMLAACVQGGPCAQACGASMSKPHPICTSGLVIPEGPSGATDAARASCAECLGSTCCTGFDDCADDALCVACFDGRGSPQTCKESAKYQQILSCQASSCALPCVGAPTEAPSNICDSGLGVVGDDDQAATCASCLGVQDCCQHFEACAQDANCVSCWMGTIQPTKCNDNEPFQSVSQCSEACPVMCPVH